MGLSENRVPHSIHRFTIFLSHGAPYFDCTIPIWGFNHHFFTIVWCFFHPAKPLDFIFFLGESRFCEYHWQPRWKPQILYVNSHCTWTKMNPSPCKKEGFCDWWFNGDLLVIYWDLISDGFCDAACLQGQEVISWRNLEGDEWIFIRGIAQHGVRER